jgi:hypothetical protein
MKIKVKSNGQTAEIVKSAMADSPEQDKSLAPTPLPPPPRPTEQPQIIEVARTDDTPSGTSQINLEEAFGNIFNTTKSGTGEEELLRIASQFSLQLTGAQMKLLSYLLHRAERSQVLGEINSDSNFLAEAQLIRQFVVKWLEYKQNNNSDVFVMKALEHISLRHFINENSFKVNIDKG